MKTAKGSKRRVLILKNFVIKIPIIYWKGVLFILIDNFISHWKNIKKCGIYNYLQKRKEWKSDLIKFKNQYDEEILKQEKQTEITIPRGKRYEQWCTVEFYLLGGIMANRQERLLFKKTKNIFLAPTYFSFFGLFNIQKREDVISRMTDEEIEYYIINNSKNIHQIWCDRHALSKVKNFGVDNGHLKIIDYGNRRLEPFIKINGENLHKNFKVPI